MKLHHRLLLLLFLSVCLSAHSGQRVSLDDCWRFAFGHTDPARDFGTGTEYFNYLTKAASIHNEGPYSPKFDDSAWTPVTLPHDFVVDLPYAPEASHSHGYKTVGYKYPDTSVGWYRRSLPSFSRQEAGRRYYVTFDGIFRDSRVWFNGFYLGGEPSGYILQRYDITPYINYDGDNLLAVRSDATLEEGWFYEGGGIYRHVWLESAPAIHFKPSSLRVSYDTREREFGTQKPLIDISGTILNASPEAIEQGLVVKVELLNPDGSIPDGSPRSGVNYTSLSVPASISPRGEYSWHTTLRPDSTLRLWSPDSPELYDIRVTLAGTSDPDTVVTRTGFRDIKFDPDSGLLVNGKSVRIRGVNQHQDHAGVGTGIPDAVNIYRLCELKKYGVNTIRSSHNPMTPEVLAACDSLGLLVIEENRLLGINDYHTRQLSTMIDRDFNHPSVILWSVGNEEWGVEWDPRGTAIVSELRDIAHRLDPTRPMTVATSGGPSVVITPDVAGYNYIMQNPVDQSREKYPDRRAFGSEETTGCGTRGIYFDDRDNGRMMSLNRVPDLERDSTFNRIARGLNFYAARPWLAGLCYWTGFDYRGEPNPLKYPATGSQFGILDYCGFPKDEAYYLKSQWTDEPVLHLLPHWNLSGHEGDSIQIWAYSNLDEIRLTLNGRSLGSRKANPEGYFSWTAVYAPGRLVAKGYRNGRCVLTRTIETTGPAVKTRPVTAYEHDGIRIINIDLLDSRGRLVPDASPMLSVTMPEGTLLLGCGNGDPALRVPERPSPSSTGSTFEFPAFNGHAQLIVTGAPDTPLPSVEIVR